MPMPQYNGPTYGYNPYQTYLPQSPWQGPQPYTQPQTAQLPVQQVQTQASQSLIGHIVTARLRGPSERRSRIFPHAGWFVDPRQVVAAGWHHCHGPLYSGGPAVPVSGTLAAGRDPQETRILGGQDYATYGILDELMEDVMPGPDDILQRMLQQNPVVRNNPNNAPILNALEHRDAQSGQQLAQNYINTLGMDWNTALQQAKAFLGLP